MSKKTIKNKRIYIGPCEIAGYYLNLTKGFKELGFNVDYITYKNHHFNYEKEINLPFLIKIVRFFNKFKNNNRNTFKRLLIALPGDFFSFIWAVTAIFKYDVFIFGFGQSLLRYNLDLYILKAFKKTVISNLAHGSEARPAYINGAIHEKCHQSSKSLIREAKLSKKIISRHEKFASYIIGSPFSNSHFASKKFINWFAIGIPSLNSRLSNLKINVKEKSNVIETVKILHCPSRPTSKGSNLIKRAISNLKNKGYDIEFKVIEGKSNSEVIEELKRCDFVVDQVFSDTPMAGFSAEAAFYAKPSVVGGYGLKQLTKLIPIKMIPPSKICDPDKIEKSIETLLINVNERILLGKMAQDFIMNDWNSINVAKRYIKIINGDIPESWWIDPFKIFYFEGYGQTREFTKRVVHNIIKNYGLKSLQLNHNTKLEEAFSKFCNHK